MKRRLRRARFRVLEAGDWWCHRLHLPNPFCDPYERRVDPGP